MSVAALEARAELSGAVRQVKARVADLATEALLSEHPETRVRLGDQAHQQVREDAASHIDHLAGAVDSGNPAAFGEYTRWAVGLLNARGLPLATVTETLLLIERSLQGALREGDQLALRPYFVEGRRGCNVPQRVCAPTPSPLLSIQRLFLQSLLAADRRTAASIATDALSQGTALMDVYVEVVQESLYELGRLWQADRITVAQEHAGTAVCQYVLAELYASMPLPRARRGRAVITGVEGEFHQIGGNLVADALEADGWHVRFLGANTPSAGVLHALAEFDAAVLGISVTMVFNIAMTRELVRDAREQLPSLSVIVGGAAFGAAPDLWREVGADAHATDVRAAVAALRGATPGQPMTPGG